MNNVTSYYPVLCTFEGETLVAFFQRTLGFDVVFQSDWYWHLSLSNQPSVNIAFVKADHDSIPEGFRQPLQGVILTIEMQDIGAYYDQQQQCDWNLVMPLRSEPWGQRHFMVASPVAGLLLDFVQVTAPSEDYKDNYISDAAPVY